MRFWSTVDELQARVRGAAFVLCGLGQLLPVQSCSPQSPANSADRGHFLHVLCLQISQGCTDFIRVQSLPSPPPEHVVKAWRCTAVVSGTCTHARSTCRDYWGIRNDACTVFLQRAHLVAICPQEHCV